MRLVPRAQGPLPETDPVPESQSLDWHFSSKPLLLQTSDVPLALSYGSSLLPPVPFLLNCNNNPEATSKALFYTRVLPCPWNAAASRNEGNKMQLLRTVCSTVTPQLGVRAHPVQAPVCAPAVLGGEQWAAEERPPRGSPSLLGRWG